MQDTLMAEPLVLVSLLLVTSFLLWLLADSDDDNSGGGLRQPCFGADSSPSKPALVRTRRAIQNTPHFGGAFFYLSRRIKAG